MVHEQHNTIKQTIRTTAYKMHIYLAKHVTLIHTHTVVHEATTL